jgi:hypothetical protein
MDPKSVLIHVVYCDFPVSSKYCNQGNVSLTSSTDFLNSWCLSNPSKVSFYREGILTFTVWTRKTARTVTFIPR